MDRRQTTTANLAAAQNKHALRSRRGAGNGTHAPGGGSAPILIGRLLMRGNGQTERRKRSRVELNAMSALQRKRTS